MGKVIRYDTVSKLGWSAIAQTHGIKVIIEKPISVDWEDGDEGNPVPAMVEEDDCGTASFILSWYAASVFIPSCVNNRTASIGNMETSKISLYHPW
jgi:hypothetical protein